VSHPLKALLGGKTISHFGTLGKIYGVHAGMLLAQLCFWDGKGVDPEWTYKTAEEIYNELGMTEAEQKTARAHLVKCGVIAQKRKGNPYRYWFKINMEVLEMHLAQFEQDPKFRAFEDKRRKNTFKKDPNAQVIAALNDAMSPDNMQQHPPILSLAVHRVPEITTEENNFSTTGEDLQNQSSDAMWDALPSASTADIVDNGLIPMWAEEKHLFKALNVERAARHYTPYTRFNTTKQREKFRRSVAVFNGTTTQHIDEIIENGKRDLEGVVNVLDGRRKRWRGESHAESPPVQENNVPVVDMSKVIIR